MEGEEQRVKTFENWTLDFLSPTVMAAAGFYYYRDDVVRCAFCKIEQEKKLEREEQRVKTFEHWPLDFLSPTVLAAAGFYYYRDDVVRCAFCKIEICKWEKGDIPMKEHKRWSSNCPFVRGVPCDNIPIQDSNSSHGNLNGEKSEDSDLFYATCGIQGEMRPFAFCDDEYPSTSAAQTSSLLIMKARHSIVNHEEELEQSPELPLERLGVRDLRAPVYPEYCTEAARLQSYSTWPYTTKQRPNDLAEAGFYYTGNGDQTMCFHCGGRLMDWEDGDDPWIEHAKWFSKCYFVNLVKGCDFVSQFAETSPVIINDEIFCKKNNLSPNTDIAILHYQLEENLEEQENAATKKEQTAGCIASQAEVNTANLQGQLQEAEEQLKLVREENCELKSKLQEIMRIRQEEKGRLREMILEHLVKNLNNQKQLNAATKKEKAARYDANLAESNKLIFQRKFEEAEQKLKLAMEENSNLKSKIQEMIRKLEDDRRCSRVCMEENEDVPEKQDEVLLCRVCHEDKLRILFLPCKHLGVCDKCANSVTVCPFCRQKFTQFIKVFIP